jgi:hypothetical protein
LVVPTIAHRNESRAIARIEKSLTRSGCRIIV